MSSLSGLSKRFHRRELLQGAAAVAGAAAFSQPARWVKGSTAPNDRLGVASVGLGGMGRNHLKWCAGRDDIRIAALCDVDQRHLLAASADAPDADAVHDFRDAIHRADVDAVVVATPDHWHALVTIAAAQAGKHVYCEKPLANSIGEGRAMADAVREAGVVLQTGSHERSNPGASVARRLVAEGKLGDVRLVRVHLPNSDQHLQEVENFTAPPPDSDPPKELDYDFWLGHTPVMPYNERRCHFWWRFHSNYGGGEMTDRGAHVIDLAHAILGLDATGPVRVEAKGRRPQGDFYDAFITFEFENHYANGLRIVGDNSGPRGLTLEGTEGKLFVAVHGCALKAAPASLLDGVELPRKDANATHRLNWLDGIRTGAALAAPAEAGHRTASACHLNNLAMRLGRGFEWDPQAERSSDDEVNAFLTPAMRPPWGLT